MPAVRRPIPGMPSQGIRRKSSSTSPSASAAASASVGPDGAAPSRHPARFAFWELRTGAGRGRTSEYDVLGAAYFPLRFSEEGASFRRRCSTLCFMPRSVSPGRSSGRSAGFGGRCSALCFRPRSVSSGRGFGRSADSGVWCSCTAFHAAPVIEEQVRMACVPHSSCLFQIGPAERQHRAAPPAGCPSYLHCTAVCSAQRRQSPPPAAAGRGHKDFAGGRSAGTFDASRLRGRGGSGRSALADSYSIGRMRTSATPFKARSRRSRSVFSSTSP